MFIFVLIIIAIIIAVVLFKKVKQKNQLSKKDILKNGEEIYKTYRKFLISVKNIEISDQELQKVMCFIDGFDNLTEKESELKNRLISDLSYVVMNSTPHIYVKINNKELDSFIYTCDNYVVQFNKESRDLEISKIR